MPGRHTTGGVVFSSLLLLLLSSSFAALLVTVAAAAATDNAEHRTVRLDQQQKDAMRMIIKDIIGFRKLPSSDAVLPTLSDGASSVQFGHRNQRGPSAAKRLRATTAPHRVPGVMQRLYDQYQNGAKFHEADTVRNIHAQLAIIDNSTLFVFNLSSISETESIVSSQIHVYAKSSGPHAKAHPQRKSATIFVSSGHQTAATNGSKSASSKAEGNAREASMKVFELAPSYIDLKTTFAISQSHRPGWHFFDVTNVIRQLLAKTTPADRHLMAVSFMQKAGTPDGATDDETSRLLLASYYRRFSHLILLVFTKQQQQQNAQSITEPTDHHHLHSDQKVANGEQQPASGDESEQQVHNIKPTAADAGGREMWLRHRTNSGASSRTPIGGKGTKRGSNDDVIVSSEADRKQYSTVVDGGSLMRKHDSSDRRRNAPADRNRLVNMSRKTAINSHFTSSDASAVNVLTSGKATPIGDDTSADSGNKPRTKRNVDDNEILDVEVTGEAPAAGPQQTASGEYNLPPRTHNRRVLSTVLSQHRHHQNHHHPRLPQQQQPQVDSSTALPNVYNETTASLTTRTSRRRSRPKESKKRTTATNDKVTGDASQLLPDPSEYSDSGGANFWNEEPDDGLCKRRRLMVDFADIGWADWVIAPKSFEAFYCDGECPFPINKKLRPTNHASIQSIVKAVGIRSAVPSPCCVPSSLAPLPLLYVDENNDIVLRNYPDMSVRACGCR